MGSRGTPRTDRGPRRYCWHERLPDEPVRGEDRQPGRGVDDLGQGVLPSLGQRQQDRGDRAGDRSPRPAAPCWACAGRYRLLRGPSPARAVSSTSSVAVSVAVGVHRLHGLTGLADRGVVGLHPGGEQVVA